MLMARTKVPKGGKREPLPVSRRRLLSEVATALQADASEPIKKPEAARLARYLISLLVPCLPPGKKATREVALAVEMRRDGTPWAAIYPKVFATFSEMPRYERSWRCHRLRRAVAALARRRRLRASKRGPHEKKSKNV